MAQHVLFVLFNSNHQVALCIGALFIIMAHGHNCISIELYEIVQLSSEPLRNLTCTVHVFALTIDYVRKF